LHVCTTNSGINFPLAALALAATDVQRSAVVLVCPVRISAKFHNEAPQDSLVPLLSYVDRSATALVGTVRMSSEIPYQAHHHG
jgi:hypothetical protein